MSAARPASPPTRRTRPRSVDGAAISARKRALSEWDKANPGIVYDPELFQREILPRLASVKLMDIAEAAGCSKASASDIRRGKWAPHVSTWAALAGLVGVVNYPADKTPSEAGAISRSLVAAGHPNSHDRPRPPQV